MLGKRKGCSVIDDLLLFLQTGVYEWIQLQLQNGILLTAADICSYLQVLLEVFL